LTKHKRKNPTADVYFAKTLQSRGVELESKIFGTGLLKEAGTVEKESSRIIQKGGGANS